MLRQSIAGMTLDVIKGERTTRQGLPGLESRRILASQPPNVALEYALGERTAQRTRSFVVDVLEAHVDRRATGPGYRAEPATERPGAYRPPMPDMPKFEKPPAALVERFNAVVDRVAPDAGRRPMFGHPCAWVGGNMATGLFADNWWVRLAPDRLAAVLESGEATTFEVMPGRTMKGYAVIPKAVVDDDAGVDAWVREGIDYTGTLPPKK